MVQKVLRKCVVKVLNFLNNCVVSIRKLNGMFMYILYGIFSGKNGYMYEKIDLLKKFCTYCMVFLLILQITKFLVYIRRVFIVC